MTTEIYLPPRVAERLAAERDSRANAIQQNNNNLLGVLFVILEEVGTEVGDRLEFVIPARRVRADRPLPMGRVEYKMLEDGSMCVYWQRTE